MRAQQFCARSLRSGEPWNWLLTEFSEYYGVTDTYTRLRYLACDIVFINQIWNVIFSLMSWMSQFQKKLIIRVQQVPFIYHGCRDSNKRLFGAHS